MGIGFPKPRRRLVDRVKEKRARDVKAEAFRKAVWKRDEGKCRHCGREVIHTLELVPNAGHVHHRRGRNVAPEDKYNVARALLLCGICHGDTDVIARYRV
jgi:5-methylcytosine-specific restriction endonuclease McrA